MEKHIALIRGDGIGPEIMTQAVAVLDAVAERFGHHFIYQDAPMGGSAIDAFGVPLPESSLETCLASDSVLLSAIGGSVGALLGMRVFHHKTLHRSFRIGVPVILILQILVPVGLWVYWRYFR